MKSLLKCLYVFSNILLVGTLGFSNPLKTKGALEGQQGLIATPIMKLEGMPHQLLGVGVDVNGKIYVSRKVRTNEQFSLLRYPYLHETCMSLSSMEEKREAIEKLYPRVINSRKNMDYNNDGVLNLKDLSTRSDKIYTLQDLDQDGIYDKAKLFAEGFNDLLAGSAHSVTPIDGHVYATILPDVWKLKDTNGDGVADQRESIAHGFAPHFGYGYHDLHCLVQGYDGKLYWSMGDRGVDVKTVDGKRISNPHSGCILRSNLDGTDFEIYATGLRNCQYFDFDDFGNIFSVDHDADFQGEMERLVYLPEGSDSGWRMYYQYRTSTRHMKSSRNTLYNPWMAEKMWVPYHKGQPTHLLPPIENSWNAPASFSFQPGAALGGKYQNHFFLGGRGEIRAFQMFADGANFKRQGDDIIVSGLSDQVLTSTFAPDGKLYFTLWNRRPAISPLWTLQDIERFPQTNDVEILLQKGFSVYSSEQLIQYLHHADRRVRLQAQFQLVKNKSMTELKKSVLDSSQPLLVRLHSLWALGQLKDRDSDLIKTLAKDQQAEMRAQLARFAGDLGYDPDQVLVKLILDPSLRVRAMASIACGKLKQASAFQNLTQMVVENDLKDKVVHHSGIVGLAGCGTAKQLKSLSKHPSEALRLAALVALRRQGSFQELIPFMQDPSEQVVSDAIAGAYDISGQETETVHEEAMTMIATKLNPNSRDAINIRAIAANRRIGTAKSAKRLLHFAKEKEAALSMRLEALLTLESWNTTSKLDPVDGRYFPVKQGDVDALKTISGSLWRLSEAKDLQISEKTIAVLKNIPMDSDQLKFIHQYILNSNNPTDRRLLWIEWLAMKDRDLFESIGKDLLVDLSPDIRRMTAEKLYEHNASNKVLHAYLSRTIKTSKHTLELQTGVKLLTASIELEPLLEKLFEEMRQGKVPQAIQLDILEAVQKRAEANANLMKQLQDYQKDLKQKSLLEQYQVSLKGGDVKAGKSIFLSHPQAQCSKCHAIKKEDQQVGPSLEGLSERHNIDYLLESIVDPQAKIAPGYGFSQIELQDGTVLAGTLMEEHAQHTKLKLPDSSIQLIPQEDIKKQSEPIGMMPDLKNVLNKRQIRDLVAFLATL